MSAADEPALIEKVIARLGLFRGVARRNLAPVARGARIVRAPRSADVARRGEPLPGVFAVIEGMVKIALRGAGGAERVLRFVGAGDSFGEAAVLLGRASAVEAVTLADSLLVVLPAEAIRALAARDAGFAHALARQLAERMLALLAEIESSELRPAAERLAAYLLSLAQPVNGGFTARLPATKTLVASRLGMKKETLSRLLHDLTSRKLIEVSRRDIVIVDRGGLAALASRA